MLRSDGSRGISYCIALRWLCAYARAPLLDLLLDRSAILLACAILLPLALVLFARAKRATFGSGWEWDEALMIRRRERSM